MASESIIILVSDKGDSKHGEISVLDDPHKAERLVETLLEAGFEAERIKVFTGRPSEFQVSQRPVVALVGDGEEDQSRMRTGIESGKATSAELPPDAEAQDPDSGARGDKVETMAEVKEEEEEEEEEKEKEEEAATTAQEAAPVRFSSLFRSA